VVSSGIISTVDNFIGTEENIATTDKDKESNKQLFINNLKPELDSGKVILYSMESGEACELLFKQDKWFDCIFIDGSHDYESVKRDICMWSRLVKKGGILCGHDYNISHFGVKDAVDELFPNAITRPEGLITDIYCQSIWIQPL
jgi:predicted O-methyltransferase YrrM